MLTDAILSARRPDDFGSTYYQGRVHPPVPSEWTNASTFARADVCANDDIPSLRGELAFRLAAAQREFFKISMYLSRPFRERTLKQLEVLLDPEGWDEEDTHLQLGSVTTFARSMAVLIPSNRPMLGLSDRGFLLAVWKLGEKQLSLEFLSEDRIKWFASSNEDGELETSAGEATTLRLPVLLDAHAVGPLLHGEG